MEVVKTIEEDFVQKIFALDRRVRFVGIIDDQGELIKGGMRKGLTALEPSKKDEDKLYLKWFLMQTMTDEWNTFLGKKVMLYTRHEKLDMYGIPLRHSRILLVSTEQTKGSSSAFFGEKLLDLVKSTEL
jgi:hypothetical protein